MKNAATNRAGLTTALVLAALLLLSACGKKGPPSPVGPPEEITWPRTYPTR